MVYLLNWLTFFTTICNALLPLKKNFLVKLFFDAFGLIKKFCLSLKSLIHHLSHTSKKVTATFWFLIVFFFERVNRWRWRWNFFLFNFLLRPLVTSRITPNDYAIQTPSCVSSSGSSSIQTIISAAANFSSFDFFMLNVVAYVGTKERRHRST